MGLERADFTHAALRGAKVHGGLIGADLNHANLRGADLSNAVLVDSRERAIFTGAEYDGRTKWPPGFDPEAAGAIRV